MKRQIYKTLGLCTLISFFLLSCQQSPDIIQDDVLGKKTEIIDTEDITSNIKNASDFNFSAQKEVDSAKKQIAEAKLHLRETEALIVEMKRNKSRYSEQLTSLKTIFGGHIDSIETHLIKTGYILKDQIIALQDAKTGLATATERIKTLESERDRLRATITSAQKELKKAKDYEEKYHKLQKYKWIVWGLGAWILIKFLGGLGAWSPQGRIAKALIG